MCLVIAIMSEKKIIISLPFSLLLICTLLFTRDATQSVVMPQHVVCPSIVRPFVCPSVRDVQVP